MKAQDFFNEKFFEVHGALEDEKNNRYLLVKCKVAALRQERQHHNSGEMLCLNIKEYFEGLQSRSLPLILDMFSVMFMDHSGLLALCHGKRGGRSYHGGKFIVAYAQEPVLRLIRNTQFDEVFDLRENLDCFSKVCSATRLV